MYPDILVNLWTIFYFVSLNFFSSMEPFHTYLYYKLLPRPLITILLHIL